MALYCRSTLRILARRGLPIVQAGPEATTARNTVSKRYQHAKSGVLTELDADSQAAQQHKPPIIKRADYIDADKLKITKTKNPKIVPTQDIVFGHSFTDHMLTIKWNAETGWDAPHIRPYAPLELDPSSTVFHYAPCLFEGMKAYLDDKGAVRLFRPDKNMERMRTSAKRLAFPDFDGATLTKLIQKLVSVDKNWIPNLPNHSLYIRPTMIGTQASLGVNMSNDVLLFVIACPVGPYYKTGFKPVSLLASTKYVRAFPGGTGGFKLGLNYASGVVPQIEAAKDGYQQILWLHGEDHQLTEVGTMNLFVVLKDEHGGIEVITPPLGDTILPGVTRDSILTLAYGHASGRSPLEGLPHNLTVNERNVTMAEILKAESTGRLVEVFGSGTAAIVSPVNRIGYEGKDIAVPVGEDGLGDVARVMLREMVGRQTGAIESDWSVKFD